MELGGGRQRGRGERTRRGRRDDRAIGCSLGVACGCFSTIGRLQRLLQSRVGESARGSRSGARHPRGKVSRTNVGSSFSSSFCSCCCSCSCSSPRALYRRVSHPDLLDRPSPLLRRRDLPRCYVILPFLILLLLRIESGQQRSVRVRMRARVCIDDVHLHLILVSGSTARSASLAAYSSLGL